MTSPALQDWFYIELTAKAYADGTSTTFKFSNRPVIDDSSAVFSDYDALLMNISGVGSKMGQYLPFSNSGVATLNNAHGSYGFQRRFSDILERYTIIDQAVKIYAAQTQYNDYNVTADFSLAHTAKVKSWRADPERGTLDIQFAGTVISPRVVTKVIDSVSFPSAPSQSLGKVLPLVFGASQEVPAVRIAADGDGHPEYAYATTLSTTFPGGGVQAYYARDHRGKYQAVKTAPSFIAGGHNDTADAAGLSPTDGYEYGYQFTTPSDAGYIVTAVMFYLYIGTAASTTSEITVSICETTDTIGNDRFRLCEGKISHTTSASGVSQTFVVWSRPVVLKPETTYYFCFQRNSGSHGWAKLSGAASATVYLKTPSGTVDNGTWIAAATAERYSYTLLGAELTDTASSAGATADGLGYAYFEVTQTAFAVTDQLPTLDFVVAINGIKDDSSGTITGTVSLAITRADHAINLLDRQWSGSAWAAGQYDSTQFQTTHNNNVVIRGATTGRTTAEQALTDICKNAGWRIALYNGTTKQLAGWEYGTTQAASAVITDEDAVVNSTDQRGIETVVNRVTLYYDRRYRDLDVTTGSSQGQFKNYAGALDLYPGLGGVYSDLSTISNTLYGLKPAAEAAYDYISTSASATWLGQYLLANGGQAHTYVQIEVPFFKYRALECLQIIEILHPDLPSYFGTSANAKLPSYTGTDVELISGHYWKRAKRYRAQIEAKEMIFNPGGISRLRLDCRLLTNSKEAT